MKSTTTRSELNSLCEYRVKQPSNNLEQIEDIISIRSSLSSALSAVEKDIETFRILSGRSAAMSLGCIQSSNENSARDSMKVVFNEFTERMSSTEKFYSAKEMMNSEEFQTAEDEIENVGPTVVPQKHFELPKEEAIKSSSIVRHFKQNFTSSSNCPTANLQEISNKIAESLTLECDSNARIYNSSKFTNVADELIDVLPENADETTRFGEQKTERRRKDFLKKSILKRAENTQQILDDSGEIDYSSVEESIVQAQKENNRSRKYSKLRVIKDSEQLDTKDDKNKKNKAYRLKRTDMKRTSGNSSIMVTKPIEEFVNKDEKNENKALRLTRLDRNCTIENSSLRFTEDNDESGTKYGEKSENKNSSFGGADKSRKSAKRKALMDINPNTETGLKQYSTNDIEYSKVQSIKKKRGDRIKKTKMDVKDRITPFKEIEEIVITEGKRLRRNEKETTPEVIADLNGKNLSI